MSANHEQEPDPRPDAALDAAPPPFALRQDPARLAAVRDTGLLDAEAPEAFDRLVRLAARVLGAPAAFLSLVDARRDFYVSAVGLGEPLASVRELTGPTFCHHALGESTADAPLVIRDAVADPVYREVPTVRSLGVAAYVGVPVTVGEHAVGALCVIDTVPRDWSAEEVELLRELGASARRELELRAALAAAEAARARTADTLESIGDAFFALDARWHFTYVNAAAERYWGRTRLELLGRDFWAAFPQARGSENGRALERAMRERAAVTWEARSPLFGTWLHARAYPASDGGLAVSFQDVEERKRTEAALRHSEERYALAARATSDAIWDWDLTTDGLTWNDGVHEVFGYARGTVPNGIQWWYDAIHPDDRERVVAGIRTVVEGAEHRGGGHAWRDEYRFRRGDGSYAFAVDRGYVARDAEGRATRMIGAMTDVTAERRAREERDAAHAALAASEARLRTVFEQAPIAIAVMEGPDHVYTVVSPRYADTPGGGRPLMGRPFREAFPEIEGTGYFEVLDNVYRTGEPYFAAERRVLIDRGGPSLEARFFDVGYQPLRDAHGRVYAVASATYDVTAQVHARHEVEAARRAAEAAREAAESARRDADTANRARADFLAVMSHELRTPLNAIGGYAELMEIGVQGPVTEPQREFLRRIQRSQRHLLGLVNEVLNYAKLEAGSVHYDVADVQVLEAVLDAEGLVAPQARAKRLSLVVGECPPDLAVRADPEKLRQVLVNLLSNAVKFTERGGVTVDVGCEAGRAAGTSFVAVRVRDTGTGIATDKLGAIFEPFVQVRADLARPQEGVGLGLAISRDLARGMGGDLTAESTPGAGSTFTLTLPRA